MTGWRPATVALVAASLVATAAASAIAASMDAPELLLAVPIALGALAAALLWPDLLLYAYCAAIPLTFALPPGPLGTVARLAGMAFFVGYLLRKPGSLDPSTIPVVGWVLLGWTTLSCLWAIDTQTAFSVWLSLVQLFAITVLVASIVAANPGVVRNALWWYAASATVTAIIGSVSYLQGPSIFLARAAAFPEQGPALWASLLLPAAVFLMSEAQSRTTAMPLRLISLTALTICVVAMALSGTRSAWVGLAVATLAWLLIRRDPRQMVVLVAVACGVAVLVSSVPGIGDFLFGRVASGLETGGAGRTDIWIVGLGIFASAPLVGVGLGNFGVAFTPNAIWQASGASDAVGALVAGRAPHNVLLGISVETGIVGGILLIMLLVSALRPSNGDRLSVVVRVALVGLIVQSMFLDLLLQKQLWLFLALAFGLASERVRSTEQPAIVGRARNPAPA